MKTLLPYQRFISAFFFLRNILLFFEAFLFRFRDLCVVPSPILYFQTCRYDVHSQPYISHVHYRLTFLFGLLSAALMLYLFPDAFTLFHLHTVHFTFSAVIGFPNFRLQRQRLQPCPVINITCIHGYISVRVWYNEK